MPVVCRCDTDKRYTSVKQITASRAGFNIVVNDKCVIQLSDIRVINLCVIIVIQFSVTPVS